MKFFRSYTPDSAKHRLITSGCLNSEFAAWYAPNEAPIVEIASPGDWQLSQMNGTTSSRK
jgi:hypothetical protein